MTTMLSMLGGGALISLEIFFITLVGALPLGLLVALCRTSRCKPLAWLMRAYISIMRGTPLMLQLLLVYFGPYYIFGIHISSDYRLVATSIAFILNYAAYFGEIYRAGIESIPRGQREAADVLGYSRAQCFVKIILPQVFKRVLPPITNEVITLVKDTSLAFAIGVAEMFTTAQALAASQTSMVPFIIAAVFYYLFNALVAFAMGRIEKGMSYYHE
jgi:polar amino acid transport system permease protein